MWELKKSNRSETTFYVIQHKNIYNGIINGSARPGNMPYIHKKKKKKTKNSALFTFNKVVLHASREAYTWYEIVKPT